MDKLKYYAAYSPVFNVYSMFGIGETSKVKIEERIKAKKDKSREVEAYQKKILLNSWFFGKLGMDGSWIKDIIKYFLIYC